MFLTLGQGYPIRVKSVIKKITEFTKRKPLLWKIKLRTDETHSIFADINSAKKEFNWSPKTDLKHGLIKTIKFYKIFNGL